MRISVVIPAFNARPWVGHAIESVLGQDLSPHEVIVVDDGSTDGTGEVVRAHTEVRILTQANRGAAAARNAGAGAAGADALLFLDADDALLPGALSHLSAVADRLRGWGAIVPNHLPAGVRRRPPRWARWPEERVLGRRHIPGVLRANHLAANALVRSETFRRHRFREDLRVAEDLDFWLRLLLAGERVALLGRPLVCWRDRRPDDPAASRTLVQEREGRRRVFESLWRRTDLSAAERAFAAYQLVRVTAGEMVARYVDVGAMQGTGPMDSSNPVVRATRFALGTPGLVPGLALLDGARRR